MMSAPLCFASCNECCQSQSLVLCFSASFGTLFQLPACNHAGLPVCCSNRNKCSHFTHILSRLRRRAACLTSSLAPAQQTTWQASTRRRLPQAASWQFAHASPLRCASQFSNSRQNLRALCTAYSITFKSYTQAMPTLLQSQAAPLWLSCCV